MVYYIILYYIIVYYRVQMQKPLVYKKSSFYKKVSDGT